MPDIDDADPDTYDQYVGAEVLLQKGDQVQSGRVVGRKRKRDGSLFGSSNVNPILDTRTYEVEFPDGEVAEFSANMIAESMYAQCDVQGNQFLLMAVIIDHEKSSAAVDHADWFITVNGRQYPHKMTKGWRLILGVTHRSEGIISD